MKSRPSPVALFAAIALSIPILLSSPLGASPRHAPSSAPPASIRRALDRSARSYVPHEVLVRFTPGAARSVRLGTVASVVPSAHTSTVRGTGVQRVRLPISTSVPAAVRSLGAQPGVAAVQPDYLYRPTVLPTDADFDEQWGLRNTGQSHPRTIGGISAGTPGADVNVTTAWDTTQGSAATVIAVIDTGVQLDHPDLGPNIWTNPGETGGNGVDDDHNGFVDDVHGYDFLDHDPNPSPMFDGFEWDIHGTHVAGIIAAANDSTTGTVGVCPMCSIMPLRVGTDFGGLSDAAVIAAITYARQNGADVMNMSFGGQGWSRMLRTAIQKAGKAGVLSVVSAGNDNGFDNDSLFITGSGALARLHSPEFPASFALPTILSVAASNDHDRYAGFSNRGRVSVDLAAPGVDILSTVPSDDWGFLDGTSMAAPFVAGVAGLVGAQHPGYSPVAVKNAILRGVDRPHGLAGGLTLTNGRLNAAKALTASTKNATPRSDGTIAGAIPFAHAKGGTLSFPVDVNDVFRVHLKKGHRYLARLGVPKTRNFDLWVWAPGTQDVWQVEPGCTAATCHVVNAGIKPKGKDEAVKFGARRAGVYYLIVTTRGGAGRYRLSLKPL